MNLSNAPIRSQMHSAKMNLFWKIEAGCLVEKLCTGRKKNLFRSEPSEVLGSTIFDKPHFRNV